MAQQAEVGVEVRSRCTAGVGVGGTARPAWRQEGEWQPICLRLTAGYWNKHICNQQEPCDVMRMRKCESSTTALW